MEPTGGLGDRPSTRSTPSATTLLGREAEQAHLDDLIDRRRGVITITGRGGVGKSALALDAADRRRRVGREQVVVVPLAAVVDPVAVLEEVADAVGVRAADADLLHALLRRLRREPTLLVLDNAEHLTAAGPDIAALASEVATLAVVVTSQRRLGVTGERIVPVRPLRTPEPGITDRDAIIATPAVGLYLERAAAVSGPWVPPPDPVDVAELCRRVEGLPLAIELAAARAGTIGARKLVERDDAALVEVLRQGPSDAPDRHRDLRSALAWSYGLLEPDAQRLLRALALLDHPSDLETLTAMVGAGSDTLVVDHLSSLVDLHLVEPAGDGAFTVVPSIRAFARQALRDTERADVVGRLVTWGTSSADVPTGSLVDGLRLAVDDGRAVEARRVLVALGPRWRRARVRREQRALIERVLAMPVDGVPDLLRARALLVASSLAPPIASEAEREHLTAVLADVDGVVRDEGDDELLLEAVGARVLLTSTLGDIEAMDDRVAEAAGAAQRLGDPWWIARCEQWAGVLALRRLDIEGAIEHGGAALRIARDLRDDTLLAHTAMFLAPLTQQMPELVADVPIMEEVLTLVRRAGLTQSEVWVLPMLVDDLVAAGELETATDLAIDALELVGDGVHSAATVINLIAAVHLAAALGEDEAAARALGPIRAAVAPILATAPPYRQERHDASLALLASALGDRLDPLLRAGASLDPATAAEELLAALRDRRALVEHDRPRLTGRQLEVLDLLSRGMTNKEIGVALAVRPKTVMHHTSAIYRKLGVRGRSEAVVWAARNGLVPDG